MKAPFAYAHHTTIYGTQVMRAPRRQRCVAASRISQRHGAAALDRARDEYKRAAHQEREPAAEIIHVYNTLIQIKIRIINNTRGYPVYY